MPYLKACDPHPHRHTLHRARILHFSRKTLFKIIILKKLTILQLLCELASEEIMDILHFLY